MIFLLIEKIGSNIQRIRKSKKLTQEQLAEICNSQTSYIASIERGTRNITIQTLDKIAEGLQVPPEGLINMRFLESNEESLAQYENKNPLEELSQLIEGYNEREIQLLLAIANDIKKFSY